jgi:hypothetical protein
MSQVDEAVEEEREPPVAHARVVYLGPVGPHWEVQSDSGDPEVPPHDPQFRRNRERVVRDAERENIALEWDLGFPEEPAEDTAG